MEGEASPATGPKETSSHPLTFSRTANQVDQLTPALSTTPSSSSAPSTPSAPVSNPPGDHVTSKGAGGGQDHMTSKGSAGEQGGRSRFYFESDTLALKNNPDYRQLLKTLAILEAQKMQAIRDIEVLLQAQANAEKDPLAFVESLKNGTLEPLPRRQQVAEPPEIEWKLYIESLQSVAKQHSALHLNTRRQSRPLIASLDEKIVVPKSQKAGNKSGTFGQQWTVEEQAKFEELLKIYPPEKVERRRFEKIAKALGTRTTQQVATHVQKYFIKLANAGLPVPGRMPNMASYPKKKGKGKRSNLKRPSTFFSSLTPHVMMSSGSTPSSTSSDHTSNYDSSDDESPFSELMAAAAGGGAGGEGEEEGEEFDISGSTSPHNSAAAIKCMECSKEVKHGVYWLCAECPQTTPTHLCNDCVNSDYHSECHSPSHSLQLLSLAPPHTFVGQQDGEDTPSCFVDQDYTNFSTHGSHTGYNYLDPNFYPAS